LTLFNIMLHPFRCRQQQSLVTSKYLYQTIRYLESKHPRFFFHGTAPPSVPGPTHCHDFTFTLRHTPHSVGPLWISDQPVADTSTSQNIGTDSYSPGGIRTSNPSEMAAVDPTLRPRVNWDWQSQVTVDVFVASIKQPESEGDQTPT
jgi:hypothetical protein